MQKHQQTGLTESHSWCELPGTEILPRKSVYTFFFVTPASQGRTPLEAILVIFGRRALNFIPLKALGKI